MILPAAVLPLERKFEEVRKMVTSTPETYYAKVLSKVEGRDDWYYCALEISQRKIVAYDSSCRLDLVGKLVKIALSSKDKSLGKIISST